MNITVACEDRYRDYVIDVFKRHENSAWKLLQFCAWQGIDYASDYDGAKEYRGIKIQPLSDVGEDNHILVVSINTGYLSQIMRALYDRGIEKYSAVRWFAIHSRKDFLDKSGDRRFCHFTQPMRRKKLLRRNTSTCYG